MMKEVNIIYPRTSSRLFGLLKFKKAVSTIFAISLIACGIVNLCVKGAPWFFYVLGAECLFWIVFVKWPLINIDFMNKITEIVLAVIVYIILLDVIEGFSGWSLEVACILCFSLSIVLSAAYFIGAKRANINVVPLMLTVVISVLASILYLTLSDILWQAIVLGGVAIVSSVICAIFYRKPLALELKKKFHTI